MKHLRQLPIYVILFPALTVLILAINNLDEIQIDVLWRSILLSILLSVTIYLISLSFLSDPHRAGLISFCLLFFVLTYGHLYNLLEGRQIGKWVIGTHQILLIFWTLMTVLCISVLAHKRKMLKELTLIFNVTLLIMTSLQISIIAADKIHSKIIDKTTSVDKNNSIIQSKNKQDFPDVYFIILDKYARSDSIQAYYKYDNNIFIEGLENLGFWVPKCSRSNYAFTVMSLSSQLNMAYVENLTNNPSFKTTRALIKNNLVHDTFEELGYTTIAFDMGFTWGNFKHFDYYFDEAPDLINSWSIDPFEILYLKSTIGILLFENDVELGSKVTGSELEKKAQRTKTILEILPEIPELSEPTFTHAHFITPHPPFIFNADGTLNPNAENVDPIEGYQQQLAYIEPRILDVLEAIIDHSPTPPIITLQGDHGFGKETVTSVLLALYLPESGEAGLWEGITLINVFPHVFNTYFDTNFQYLPDSSYTHTEDWYESVLLEEWNSDCLVK